LILKIINLDYYPKFGEKIYILDAANICGIEKGDKNKFKLRILKMVINELIKKGVNEEKIIIIADANPRYKIDDLEEYLILVKQKKIIESPARILADEIILAYCINHNNALFLSNDLMKEFYPYLPDDKFIIERRITIVKIKNEIFLIPMKGHEKIQREKKDPNSVNSTINSTIDIFKLIKNTEGNFDLFNNSHKGGEKKNA